MEHTILITGGVKDPNIKYLLKTAKERKIPVFPFLIMENISPSFFWDMTNGKFLLMNKAIHPTAIFIRRDVFHQSGKEKQDRSLAWYTALTGWMAVNTEVRMLNRAAISTYTNKLNVLELAVNTGLTIPVTYVTNNIERVEVFNKELIAKPVMGGGYCHQLNSISPNTETRSSLTANPAIVQQQIIGEDIRIYRIDNQYIGFRILSDVVDYRKITKYKIKVLNTIPEEIIKSLSNLMNQMGLDWGAADFKKCDQTGQWYFLEVNSNPMFSVFDAKAEGRISNAIFQALRRPKPSTSIIQEVELSDEYLYGRN